jgi:hypothetical protein
VTDFEQAASLRERLDELSGQGGLTPNQIDDRFQDLIGRLDTIESHLGLNTKSQSLAPSPTVIQGLGSQPTDPEDARFAGLWKAIASMKSTTRQSHNRKVWARTNIKELWLS